jgi:hypothetical protein
VGRGGGRGSNEFIIESSFPSDRTPWYFGANFVLSLLLVKYEYRILSIMTVEANEEQREREREREREESVDYTVVHVFTL